MCMHHNTLGVGTGLCAPALPDTLRYATRNSSHEAILQTSRTCNSHYAR